MALDWHSGNRSVLVDHELSGVIVGQTLETTCVDMYRALLEATAFGTRMIVETFVDCGVPVTELVVAGGLLKNQLLMQIYADVVGLPLSTVPSTQAPALGSAIHAATAAGAFTDVRAAAKQMGRRIRNAYTPIPENVARLRPAVPRIRRALRLVRPRQRHDASTAPHRITRTRWEHRDDRSRRRPTASSPSCGRKSATCTRS